MAYSLKQINDAVRSDPQGFAQECDAAYNKKIEAAARKIMDNLKNSRIVLLSGPSGSVAYAASGGAPPTTTLRSSRLRPDLGGVPAPCT